MIVMMNMINDRQTKTTDFYYNTHLIVSFNPTARSKYRKVSRVNAGDKELVNKCCRGLVQLIFKWLINNLLTRGIIMSSGDPVEYSQVFSELSYHSRFFYFRNFFGAEMKPEGLGVDLEDPCEPSK